ncbi:hypothetical protein QUO84_000530 [Enterococcus faecium]|nr:hypothetical protein [Enterococcus faecium]
MKLLSIVTLPAILLGFAHASVHVSPHVSTHSAPHVSSHARSSSHPTEHATPSSKGSNHVAKENEASVKTSKKSNIHAPIVHTHHKNKKDNLADLKRKIKQLSKTDQRKMKKYIDKLVK